MEKIQDIEAKVKEAVANAVDKVREELGKIDVDVEDYKFTIAKFENGVSMEFAVKVNITKK